MKKFLLLIFIASLPLNMAVADVVKPALVEIIVDKDKVVTVEVRASIEALLTGINAEYKNTQDAPNAEKYDVLRKMTSPQLSDAFDPFQEKFLESVFIEGQAGKILLRIQSVEIPATGYTKVPRISVIVLTGVLSDSALSLRWYYPAAFGDNAVRVKQVDMKNEQWHWSSWQWLRDNEISQSFSLTEIVNDPSIIDVIRSYISIGFEHIVPKGLDHILFVLGLFLLSTHLKPLLWQVTMFTVAHTITLALAMNNIVNLPANIVEPLIALSIAYVGIENIFARKLHKSRLLLVFIFGLLHGLGFASVLSDFGMPTDDFAVALISFNIGVEFGQLAVILVAFLLLRLWFLNYKFLDVTFQNDKCLDNIIQNNKVQDDKKYKQLVVLPGSAFISMIGLYWFLERLELF